MSVAISDKLVRFAEPILVLEWRRFVRRWRPMRVIPVTFAVAMPVIFLVGRPPGLHDVVVFGAFWYLLLIVLLVPVHGARSISGERDMGRWDVLAVTPLRSSEIAHQKILAAAMPTLTVFAWGLPMAVTLVILRSISPLNMLALGVVLLLAAFVVSTLSVMASCEWGKTALIASYLPALVCLGLCPMFFAGSRAAPSTAADLADMRLACTAALLVAPLLTIGMNLLQLRKLRQSRRRTKTTLAGIAIFWLMLVIWPPLRTRVADIMPACLHMFMFCITPIGAIQELTSGQMPVLPGLALAALPRYVVTAATLAFQILGIITLRNATTTSIERLRRAA